ncbi:hypothetical protein ACPW96_20145 [Micromonospora sp. DT81.3]|uniref:hypothetical protein n=1 Tax=Micromonospora sp. DT81.3 TaxID=3416523 RepID=UPI003CEE19B9
MTTTTSEGPNMIDRSDCEATLYRLAVCAFTYYPGKETDEPGYSVDEDVDWCLAPLAGAAMASTIGSRRSIRELITNADADRQAFIVRLRELADG